MAKLLLNLRNVPDDEADDVRRLLEDNAIAWYESHAGVFRIGLAGIWVRDDAEFPRARALMDAYQQARQQRARAEHAAAVRDGTAETFIGMLRAEPLRVGGTLLAILFLLALMAWPLLLRGR